MEPHGGSRPVSPAASPAQHVLAVHFTLDGQGNFSVSDVASTVQLRPPQIGLIYCALLRAILQEQLLEDTPRVQLVQDQGVLHRLDRSM